MKFRSVANILPAQALKMGPITIHQPLPTQRVEQIDPFLLLHHFGPWTVEPGYDPLNLGPHPHRGFEPVTFLYNGGLRHRDSRNNTGILEGGDVQWMTAGMGIIHSERSNKKFLNSGGTLEGIQLWVNLAPENKFVQPRYQDMKEAGFPRHDFGNGAVLKVVAGEFEGLKGPTKTYSPIIAWQLELPAGAAVALPVPEDHNFAAYLLDGRVTTSIRKGSCTVAWLSHRAAAIRTVCGAVLNLPGVDRMTLLHLVLRSNITASAACGSNSVTHELTNSVEVFLSLPRIWTYSYFRPASLLLVLQHCCGQVISLWRQLRTSDFH